MFLEVMQFKQKRMHCGASHSDCFHDIFNKISECYVFIFNLHYVVNLQA